MQNKKSNLIISFIIVIIFGFLLWYLPKNAKVEDNSAKSLEFVKSFVAQNPGGAIYECKYFGQKFFNTITDVNLFGGTLLYSDTGKQLEGCSSDPSLNSARCKQMNNTSCQSIYRPTYGEEKKIDVYNLNPNDNTNYFYDKNIFDIPFDIELILHKGETVRISGEDGNTFQITGFENNPCLPSAACLRSGQEVYYKIIYNGIVYEKSIDNLNVAGMPFQVVIKDSDYKNYAKVVINKWGDD